MTSSGCGPSVGACGTPLRVPTRDAPTVMWVVGGTPASGEDGLLAMERWELFDFPAGFPLGEAQLVELLQVQPELRAGAEEVGQAQGGVAGDGAPAVEDSGYAVGWNLDVPGKRGGAHVELFQLLGKVFAGVDCRDGHGAPPNENCLNVSTGNAAVSHCMEVRIANARVSSWRA